LFLAIPPNAPFCAQVLPRPEYNLGEEIELEENVMKAGLALVQRLGFFSHKPAGANAEEEVFDMRLKRLIRPTDSVAAPKGLVFKTSR
jgi:hypothetical protein